FAEALNEARILLETEAHPLSREWSMLPFSDGEETCNGDVGGAMGALEASIAAHKRRQLPPLGDPDDIKPPSDDPEEHLPDVPCEPQTRSAYDTYVRDGGLHLDNIYLLETVYTEEGGANGACTLTLTTRKFGVTYGSTKGKVVWHINSAPSKTTVERKSAADGADAVSAFREHAMRVLDGLHDMATARSEIASAVQTSVSKEPS